MPAIVKLQAEEAAVKIDGLMTITPLAADAEVTTQVFEGPSNPPHRGQRDLRHQLDRVVHGHERRLAASHHLWFHNGEIGSGHI